MSGALTQSSRDFAIPSFATTEGPGYGWRHWAGVAAASVVVHLFLGTGFVSMIRLAPQTYTSADLNVDIRRQVTPLIAPPSALTQRAPNRAELTREFDLSSLPPREARPNVPSTPGAAAPPRQRFRLPDPRKAAPAPSALPEAPSLDVRASVTPPPPLGINLPAPPPEIKTQEPKLAFERPGVTTGTQGPPGVGRVVVPRAAGSVDEAVRQLSRGAGRGLIVGDEDVGGAAASPTAPSVPVPGRLGSAVELLSDPMGVDFWPYLVKVLTTVRRNWFSVVPESARLGRQGRTIIQFAISRDGTVPKLVIATPSGTDALDRAAVAGVSASNPFPPLPAEFKGSQVRLQFVFKYNVR